MISVTSEYSIELGSTTSLVFTTKIKFIYLIQITPPRGKGYKARRLSVLYYGQDNGQIIFKTNRSFEELRFVSNCNRLTDLAKNRAMIPNVVGANTRPLFRLLETNDGTKINQFDFSFTSLSRYATANSIETSL
jgi:hypothetical protein